MTRPGRFETFVGVSSGLHLLAALALFAWAFAAPKPKPKASIFELVGPPPKGDDGGEVGQRSPQTPSAAAPAPEPVAEKAPPPAPQKAPPIAPAPTKAVAKPEPKAPSKPVPAPKTAPSTGKASSGAASGTAALPEGVHAGTPGKPNGDTLSLTPGQGLPSPMAMWLSRVKFQVERNWRAPEGLVGIQAMPEIVFVVSRDGRPSRVQLKVRSGNPTLDRLALRAVQSVDAFPPVPDVWPEDKVIVRYVLQYAPQ
jgi:periplasmic protein TonB